MRDLCLQTEPRMLTLPEAQRLIETSIHPVAETETVDLSEALGRALAEPIDSPLDLPQHDNAAMDGYALSSADIRDGEPFELPVVGTAWAGRPFQGNVLPGQCVRIFTGAILPDSLDTVVMQEIVETFDNTVSFPDHIRPGQNVKKAGEDIARNAELIKPPKTLTAADLGLLASAGVQNIPVVKKLKIAYLSNGDELTSIGSPLATGQIYDSNRYLLGALLKNAAFDTTDLGIVGDDKAALEDRLSAAAKQHDVILTTGGASVGDADFIKDILERCGTVDLWKIAIKPGKPLAFGSIGTCRFFGLPGNPVAVFATFSRIVLPALHRLAGMPPERPLQLQAICDDTLKKSPGRLEFMRGRLTQTDSGELRVASAGQQGSHILTSLSRANCFIVLPADCSGIRPGDRVTVEPFSAWLG